MGVHSFVADTDDKMVTPDIDEFYVYLDSGTTNLYGGNTLNSYNYTLKAPVNLRGEWVVGLAEITIPKPDNFDVGLDVLLDPDLSPQPVILTPTKSPPMTPKKSPKKSEVQEMQHEEMMHVFYEVGDQIETQVVNMGAQIETQVADVNLLALPDFDSIAYIECDICDNHLGEKGISRPFLRRIHLQRPGQYLEPNHIHYIPVKKHNFDTIHIDIKLSDGSLVSFVKGLSMCTLHFVRKNAP